MEDAWRYSNSILALLLLLLLLALALKLLPLRGRTQRRRNLPPYPSPPLPIIGHLHLLQKPFHRTLHRIHERSGPIFSLQFGNQLVVVVSSLSAASECFGKNDVVFANRPKLSAGKYFNYDYTGITAAPYGGHWRNLRRVATLELFSSARLNAFLGVRKDEVGVLMRRLHRRTAAGGTAGFVKVELRPLLSELSLNIIMRMVAGRGYFAEGAESEEAGDFRELVREIAQLGGVSNPGDFLPLLRWIDYLGVKKKLGRVFRRADLFIQGLIDEHRRDSEDRNTMIDHLLQMQQSEPQYYTDKIIKGLVMVMLLAGTDTTSVTIEWAMSLLLNNPAALQKATAEVDGQVGQDRALEESDSPNLNYLQCIVLETLRLHPSVPLLLPHFSSDECRVGGYDIPRFTILLVNAWSIHRDPAAWDEPLDFKPERFEGEGEMRNGVGKVLAFGLGRRSCPGAGMAQRVVALALGSLIQCFDWERVGGVAVDLTEGTGLTMPKAVPLEANCRARQIMSEVYPAGVNPSGGN